MIKIVICSILLISSPAFSAQPNNCGKDIKAEINQVQHQIAKIDASNRYSEQMVDILTFSLIGMVTNAPSCDALKGITRFYQAAFKDLR